MNLFVTVGGLLYNVVIIAVCTAVIVIRRRMQKNYQEDFLFGGKRMGWFTCAASMALTGIGGAHINGLPAQAWDTGVATISFCLGMGCFFLIVMRYTGVWYRRNPNLLDYKVLTALDMPKEGDYQRIIVEKPSEWGPFGAKGFSETPITPVAPALANAVYNALGVRVYEDSLSPDVILKTWASR